MKTNKFAAMLFTTVALVALTATMVLAAPPAPGAQAENASIASNAPIPRQSLLKAHSEAWNDSYFDKNVLPQPRLDLEGIPQEKWRGGLAEQQAQNAVPQPRRAGLQAHSEAWNNVYFDRFVNTHITARTGSYVYPYQRQGGMAKGTANGD